MIGHLGIAIETFHLCRRNSSLGEFRSSSGDIARLASSETSNPMANQDDGKDTHQQSWMDSGPRFQSGVLRTNCIDCLDRTNVAQYAYGLKALGRQLHAMGLTDVPKVDPDSSIAAALMDMYQSMGDALAQQYGGSAAHNTVCPSWHDPLIDYWPSPFHFYGRDDHCYYYIFY